MKKTKEIEEMSFEELIGNIGLKPLPRNSIKPRFRGLSAAEMVRKAREELAPA